MKAKEKSVTSVNLTSLSVLITCPSSHHASRRVLIWSQAINSLYSVLPATLSIAGSDGTSETTIERLETVTIGTLVLGSAGRLTMCN